MAYALLGETAVRRGQRAAADSFFQKMRNVGFMYEQNLFQDEALFHYGLFLLNQNRFPEAEKQFREIGKVLPKSYWHGYGMALFFAKKGDKTAALDWLEKFLDNFFPDENMILEEPLFSKIRKTKLMLKHFKK